MIRYHSITCTATACDPSCEIGDPRQRGGPASEVQPGGTPSSVLGVVKPKGPSLWDLAVEQHRRGLPPEDTSFLGEVLG